MIEYVRAELEEVELLTQLAEECCELAQAALKLRRAIDGKNPTPTRLSDAYANMVEEIGDVKLCLRALGYHLDDPGYDIAGDRKLARWVDRLKKRD